MTATRDAARVRFPPPLIPLATILLGGLLDRMWPLDPGFAPDAPVRYAVGGLVVACALTLPSWAIAYFRKSGENELPWTPTTAIVAAGPYRITRNPMYLGMVLLCVGVAIVLASEWILALTPLCALALWWFAIRPEEAYLEEKFGEGYRAYKRRVRRWL
jgi:protein-S-isoprenylcysteine O-methyltransferase Ste14